MSEPGPFVADVHAFWDGRHQRAAELAAGGDRGLSEGENFELYTVRLARLFEILRAHLAAERPWELLDAGCGRGVFTDGLARAGHDVLGVDFSETAISYARAHHRGRYALSALEDIDVPAKDAVVCIDVLFHVLDDAIWERALARMTGAVRARGLFVFADAMRAERFQLGDYIVHRSREEYEAALGRLGFRVLEIVPYAFGSNPNQLVACARRVP